MARDPRENLNPACQVKGVNQTSLQRSFFQQIGKIGQVGGNHKVAEGLRTLAKISDSVRTGTGSLPTIVGSTIESGANWVLDKVGIGGNVVEKLKPFNAGVANTAVGQAKAIYTKVKSGTFKFDSVPGALQDLQNLERLARGIYTPKTDTTSKRVLCTPAPYAMDLISYATKFKFMFAAQFTFSPTFKNLGSISDDEQTNFVERNVAAALIQKFSRPKVDFDFEEVNLYNFKTRVAKNIKYSPIDLEFIDDGKNHTMTLLTNYIKAYSPITNLDSLNFKSIAEDGGLFFPTPTDVGPQPPPEIAANAKYSAALGPLYNDEKVIIQEIDLFHLFDYGQFMNVYKFFNPRFTNISFDDLSMEDGGISKINTSFVYDGVFFDRFVKLEDKGAAENRLGEATTIGKYPLQYVSVEEGSRAPG